MISLSMQHNPPPLYTGGTPYLQSSSCVSVLLLEGETAFLKKGATFFKQLTRVTVRGEISCLGAVCALRRIASDTTTMTVSLIMKSGVIYLHLILVVAQGSTKTDCVAKHGNNLMCKFPENINSTRKDFAVYFYPDTGGEEPLVDCGWMDSQFDCIEQEGFKCRQPVSDSANITVPVRFVNRTGSYRCKSDGIRLENTNPCRFNETQVQFSENKLNSWCEAHTALEGRQLIVNCAFSFDVENFTVEYNNTVVASYTKSFCRTSDVCSFGHNPHSVIVKLDNPGNLYGELRCHPDHPTLQLEVKSCRADTKMNSETFPTVAVVLPVISILTATLVAVIAILLRRRWKAQNDKRTQKKNSWRKLPMTDRSACRSAAMP